MPFPWSSNFRLTPQFVRYVLIGVLVLVVDVGGLAILLAAGVVREGAVASSFLAAMIVQFTLNRWLNFRAFDRSVVSQAANYLAVTGANLLLTLVVVDFCVLQLHTTALAGKLLSLPLTLPFSYVAHKHVTFGAGLRASLARVIGRTK